MPPSDFDATIDQLCVLQDPVRRRVYMAVREAGRPSSRAEVADGAATSVRLATFHLEKLLEEGLLEATTEAPRGRAGRPAKRYRPSDVELHVAIPPRRYDLVAEILAGVMGDRGSVRGRVASAAAAAAEFGRGIGRRVPRNRRIDDRVASALSLAGYEPADGGADVLLTNCPFSRAAEAQPDVVCPMNHALVDGLLEGVGARSLVSELDRQPGRCCVVLRRTARARHR